jgi:hypothetical protein
MREVGVGHDAHVNTAGEEHGFVRMEVSLEGEVGVVGTHGVTPNMATNSARLRACSSS